MEHFSDVSAEMSIVVVAKCWLKGSLNKIDVKITEFLFFYFFYNYTLDINVPGTS